MEKNSKTPSQTMTVMTEAVLPNDANILGNLFGGRLLQWMDIAAAIAASKHCNSVVVTASVDNVSFDKPVRIGEVINITAKVTRTFNTSLEIHIIVIAENILKGLNYQCNEAYYTFVALDEKGNKFKVPPIVPETDEEKRLYDSALRRRQLRLILAGKLNPTDATELKALFDKKI